MHLTFLLMMALATEHPLDPLNAQEIEFSAQLLRASPQFQKDASFSTIVLKEPPKEEVLRYTAGSPMPRQAFSVILDRTGNRTFEAVVDLTTKQIVSWKEVKGVQPGVLDSDYDDLDRIVKENPQWQEAMRKRGIDDFDSVQIEGWSVGQVPAAYRGVRLIRAVSYLQKDQVNFYGRPVEGVTVLVNLNTEEVIEVLDSGVVPLAPPSQELDEKSTGVREAPRRLSVSQPDGPSFQIVGNEVRWQKWRFRYAMHPREGLVLYTVGYEDEGRLRSILYRASLSEMVVPYGDTDQNWRWRAAFDVGEYSVGRMASSIAPNIDAPENATLLDATIADEEGKPAIVQRVIGIYERDGGILWRHYDTSSDKNESRRARELVAFFITTVGNYDYAISYIFHQDGTFEVDAALTGIMLPKGVTESQVHEHEGMFPAAALVSPNVAAPHHQHFFNFRLDLDVDGRANSVREMNTYPASAGAHNPSLNGMIMKETVLASEKKAARSINLDSARSWQVFNPSVRNGLGYNTGYILIPGSNSIPYLGRDSSVRRRAGFVNNHFWVTQYHPDELNAAGPYPNQSHAGEGLPKWTANDESLVNQDVVVWYTLGLTHIPRPEEWPVMGVTHVGFRLVPAGFFSRNPALDVPTRN